jgi:hypothetical protein
VGAALAAASKAAADEVLTDQNEYGIVTPNATLSPGPLTPNVTDGST